MRPTIRTLRPMIIVALALSAAAITVPPVASEYGQRYQPRLHLMIIWVVAHALIAGAVCGRKTAEFSVGFVAVIALAACAYWYMRNG